MVPALSSHVEATCCAPYCMFGQLQEEKNGAIKCKKEFRNDPFPKKCIYFSAQRWTILPECLSFVSLQQDIRKRMTISYLIIMINYIVESYLDVPKEHNQLRSPNCQVWSVFC